MALRLRRDVQKASYYVWFLGAEEAKGLRGHRVINSVLPYLIDRSRTQEPIKVTLQVSHKGIKIIQGSSKHFIPHSAITSSVQTDDIVACVLLLYNPVTKCPLHVHAYRCDSETTAEALNQQLQILINRPENQKRFEDLESRLGIIPGMPSLSSNKTSNHNEEINHKKESQQQQQHYDDRHHKAPTRSTRHEQSSKRFVSSLGSDTGNSTRESECSEDISGNSPISRSPSGLKPLPPSQQPLPNPELFDSLAAELRAKLNGNGPPLLLPPRDYDTVHRSKGNLTAIELRRCRNQLIVGSNRPGSKTDLTQNVANSSGKQVSSRGSSGIGSDLAPSPERQDITTSSDDEHWSNEADNSVIALKPSQIALDRSAPANPHHMNLTRKNAVHPRDDSYLRDLPAKPYSPRDKIPTTERDSRSKTPPSSSWNREDEIKPIIVRPTNYDSKINRVLQSEQYAYNHHKLEEKSRERSKLPDVEKSNEMAALMKKNMNLNHDVNDQRYKYKSNNSLDDFEDNHHGTHHSYRKENLTDKQKFMEYSTSKTTKPLPHTKSYAADEVQRYGGKHRYVDPADLPFEQNISRDKYAGYHRESNSPNESELSQRTAERSGARSRDVRDVRDVRDGRDVEAKKHHSRDREREHLSRSKDRNPYREPESIPYIESMEKMMKSSAMRYKSYDSNGDLNVARTKEPLHAKLSQRSKAHSQHDDERDYSYNYPTHGRQEQYNTNSSNKERFMENKEKFRAMERSGSRYDLTDEKDAVEYKSRSRGPIDTPEPKQRAYDDWSDEEHLYDDPPPEFRSRSRSRDQWVEHGGRSNVAMPTTKVDMHGRSNRARDNSGKRAESRNRIDSNDYRDTPRYRDQVPIDHHSRSEEHRMRDRDRDRDQSREYSRRDYSPDRRSGSDRAHHRSDRSMERHRIPNDDPYPSTSLTKGSPSSSGSGIGAPVPHGKAISNMPKGYRHSYAEPVFSRSAGRVGLAAVNPY